jgi:hypothetical protein
VPLLKGRVHLCFDLQFGACVGTPTQENALLGCVTYFDTKSQVKSQDKTQVDTYRAVSTCVVACVEPCEAVNVLAAGPQNALSCVGHDEAGAKSHSKSHGSTHGTIHVETAPRLLCCRHSLSLYLSLSLRCPPKKKMSSTACSFLARSRRGVTVRTFPHVVMRDTFTK